MAKVRIISARQQHGVLVKPDREENAGVPQVEIRSTRVAWGTVHPTHRTFEPGWWLMANVGYHGRERAKGEPGLYEECLAVGTVADRWDDDVPNRMRSGGKGGFVTDVEATLHAIENLCAERGWPLFSHVAPRRR